MTSTAKKWFKPIFTFAVVFLVCTLLRMFVIEPFHIPSESMETTLMTDDYVLAQKVTSELGMMPKQGDIVVFKNTDPIISNSKYLIKRVIATEGQTVEIENGYVYVDGTKLEEDYTQGITEWPYEIDEGKTVTIPNNCVWVMGDNRENSSDSRYIGWIEQSQIVGVAFYIYWPINHIILL